MLLTVLLVVLNGPPPPAGPCTLKGTVVLRRNGEVANPEGRVVVFLDGRTTAATDRAPVTHTILQQGLVFKPTMLVIQKGDAIEFKNDDTEAHSVFAPGRLPGSNLHPIAFEFPKSKQGVTGRQTFQKPGPVRILCDVHNWMRADILVVENPSFSIVDAKGQWQLPALPEGDHTLTVWEPNGAMVKVSVKHCTGATQVTVPPLDEAPKPKAQRKTGGVPPEY